MIKISRGVTVIHFKNIPDHIILYQQWLGRLGGNLTSLFTIVKKLKQIHFFLISSCEVQKTKKSFIEIVKVRKLPSGDSTQQKDLDNLRCNPDP